MRIAVTVRDQGVGLALQRMTAALQDMRPVYKAIGAKLERNAHLRFDLKEAPSGAAWVPWAPSTAAARKAEGRGTLLSYTGRMQASLTFLASASQVEVGFGVPYAAAHEFGTKRTPARPLLLDRGNLSNSDLNDALDVAMRAFRKQLKLQA